MKDFQKRVLDRDVVVVVVAALVLVPFQDDPIRATGRIPVA